MKNTNIKTIAILVLVLLTACSGQNDTSTDIEKGQAQEADPKNAHTPSYEEMTGRGTLKAGHQGAALYGQYCAQCHNQGVSRAPQLSFLQLLPGDMILRSLNEGVMRPMAAALTDSQKQEITEFLIGGKIRKQEHPLALCRPGQSNFDFSRHPHARGWGMDRENSRFITAATAQLSADELQDLELKWAFAYPNATRARSQPALAGGAVFVGSQDGSVYALDEDTGCSRWVFRTSAEIRTGITIADWDGDEETAQPPLGYFSDHIARTYAINLVTGEQVWVHKLEDHPSATATAQPVLFEDVLYQPVSSLEEASAAEPGYPCCTFRGSIVALDSKTGAVKWKTHTIEAEPRFTGNSVAGTKQYGPSGAPIWNSPTLDTRRRLLYAGTGNNYSSPAEDTSAAIVAFDLDGNIRWKRQTTSGDAWNVACFKFMKSQANCPAEDGPDVDYAAPPVLVRVAGREILVGGQKSGEVTAISLEGEILWRSKPGRGGNQGGINFGLAAEGHRVFVPVADYDDGILPLADARPGLYALDALNGNVLWQARAEDNCADREHCDPGISAPVTAIPGVVFAGHLDGRLRAYNSETGAVLWEYDTYREFHTVSGEVARGGSMSGGSGPVISAGRLLVNSGYGIYFHMPGNVLLMFDKSASVAGQAN